MKIRHEIISGIDEIIYIQVDLEDKYEFGKEWFSKSSGKKVITAVKDYANKHLKDKKNTIAILVINGVMIGAISIAGLLSNAKIQDMSGQNFLSYGEELSIYDKESQSQEQTQTQTQNINSTESVKTEEIKSEEKNEKIAIPPKTASVTVEKKATTSTKTSSTATTAPKTTTSTSQTAKTSSTTTSKTTTTTPAKTTTTQTTTKPASTTTTTTTNTVTSGVKIKLSTGGTVVTIDLEEYIVGVVAAEMPASFHSEALKAQAIAARTFAMKKTSQGITLLDSTAHQVYKTESELKAAWGSSFNTYYTKVKNAVSATKGLVMKYNGAYIDAMYFSTSNGKTEAASYVWSYSYPYLQCVSSTWDQNVKNFQVSTKFTYDTLTSKLGEKINKDTQIKVLSKTVSDRVNQIQIGSKTYTGVNLRTKLGLRSTDFVIEKYDTYVMITTKGYGHGVGMSQYGANEAAKTGYTYKQILTHYYTGIQIVKI